MNKKRIIIFSIFIFLLFVLSSAVFAQRPLEVDYPEVGGIQPNNINIFLPEYVKYIFNFVVGITGIIIFITFVAAGISYLISGGNPSKISDAKDRIKSSFIGILIIIGSYLILTTINPQLVFFELPDREIFEPEPIIQIEKELDEISYEELPLGGLIEIAFKENRLKEIKDVLEENEKTSKDLYEKTSELVSLIDSCSCSLTYPNCPDCGGANCEGDPCPVRGEIDNKREEIRDMLKDQDGFKGIIYWQDQLKLLIDGTPEGTPKEDEILGIKTIYNDLLFSKDRIRTCSDSLSQNAVSQVAMSYPIFWNYYRPTLQEGSLVKKVNPIYLFDYVDSKNKYYQTNFYCTELLYSLGESQSIKEELALLKEFNFDGEMDSSFICGQEIKLGEAIDNAESVLKIIVTELDRIDNSLTNEMSSSLNLVDFSDPSECVEGSCECSCTWVEKICCPPCPDEKDDDDTGGGDSGTDGSDWDWGDGWFWFLSPEKVYAVGDCCYDCSYCDVSSCVGYVCPGDPPSRNQIDNEFDIIQNSYSVIVSSVKIINNIIDEKGISDELKISEIFKTLESTQFPLSACYKKNDSDWKDLFSCSFVKNSADRGLPFYGADGKNIEECYGGGGQIMDNYFCCNFEFSP